MSILLVNADTYIKPMMYTSAPSFCTSDHKPVWGLFQCKLRPGIDTWVFLFDKNKKENFFRVGLVLR